MTDSFVEAQNNLKRMSNARCVIRFHARQQPRSKLLVHAYGNEVTGIKTHRGPKRDPQVSAKDPTAVTSAPSRTLLYSSADRLIRRASRTSDAFNCIWRRPVRMCRFSITLWLH